MSNNGCHQITDLLSYQLKAYWPDVNEVAIRDNAPEALRLMDEDFRDINSPRFQVNGISKFNPLMSTHWMIFLYRLSNILYKNEVGTTADQVYYLNKIMHSVDWFYAIDLPTHFLCEHPLGSVLGRASYGDYLMVYQGTTVGGSRKDGVLYYPVLDGNTIMFANSSIVGKCHVGSNVILSAGAKVVNQDIPSNSLVFGESPNLIIKVKDESAMKLKIEEYWR